MSIRSTHSPVIGLFATIISALTGCANSTCKAGETRACVGPGACAGDQVCNSDNSGWSACNCGNSSGGADAGQSSSTGGHLATGGNASTGGATTTGGGTSVACGFDMPTADSSDGGLSVIDNYVTVGSLHGYANAWTWVGSDSSATACSTPTCTAPGSLDITVVVGEGGSPLTSERVSCSPTFARSALCTAGTVTADPTYESVAALGFNFNQDIA